MAKLIDAMKQQGIGFVEESDGSVRCSPSDSQRFKALVASISPVDRGALEAQAREIAESRIGMVTVLLDRPGVAACLSAELARREIPFSVGTTDGKQSIEWRPESDKHKEELLSAAFACDKP